MPGGKGKSIGGKGGSKDSAGKTQKSHSAKAGLQVSTIYFFRFFGPLIACFFKSHGLVFFFSFFCFVWGEEALVAAS